MHLPSRQYILTLVFSSSLLVILLQGCYLDKEEILYPGSTVVADCSTIPAKFSADVIPIILSQSTTPGRHNASTSG